MSRLPACIVAADAAARTTATNYPEHLATRVAGRTKRPLGDPFGLTAFGVNLTTLPPGAMSALHHQHSKQDDWVYVLKGTVTLHRGDASYVMTAGMCTGFPAGGEVHHLENTSDEDVVILEVGNRVEGDAVAYPEDDLAAVLGADGLWRMMHKDGRPY